MSYSKHYMHDYGQSDRHKQVPSPSSLQGDVISTALRGQTRLYRFIRRCYSRLPCLVNTLQTQNKKKRGCLYIYYTFTAINKNQNQSQETTVYFK